MPYTKFETFKILNLFIDCNINKDKHNNNRVSFNSIKSIHNTERNYDFFKGNVYLSSKQDKEKFKKALKEKRKNLGEKIKENIKKKCKEIRDKQRKTKNCIKVTCIETGETMYLADAISRYNNNHIYNVIMGDRKTAAGLHWKKA